MESYILQGSSPTSPIPIHQRRLPCATVAPRPLFPRQQVITLTTYTTSTHVLSIHRTTNCPWASRLFSSKAHLLLLCFFPSKLSSLPQEDHRIKRTPVNVTSISLFSQTRSKKKFHLYDVFTRNVCNPKPLLTGVWRAVVTPINNCSHFSILLCQKLHQQHQQKQQHQSLHFL